MFNRDDLLIACAKLIWPQATPPWPQQAINWPELSSHSSPIRDISGASFHDAGAEAVTEENNESTFAGRDPTTLFREFAAECIELAQTNSSPEKRVLYLKMASIWHQMAQRWENKSERFR